MDVKATGLLKVINTYASYIADKDHETEPAYTEALHKFVDASKEDWLRQPELEPPSSRLGGAYWTFWNANRIEEYKRKW